MRILQLCKKFPYPLKDGESIAVTHLSRALNELGCEVTLLSMNTTKHYCEVAFLPRDFNHYKAIHHVPVDNSVQVWDAFLNLFSKESFHITRFLSNAFKTRLVELLKKEKFDVIQLETPVLSPYVEVIRQHSDALIAMRSHNVEHEIWQRMAENAKWMPLRWYLSKAAAKLKAFEEKHLNDYDLLLAITARDLNMLKKMGLKKPSTVIPIGLDGRDYNPDLEAFCQFPSISFIGSLDWMPNQEGLKWFLESVWPTLKREVPKIELHIAGRNTPAWVQQLRLDGIKVHGEISDSTAFINAHSMMIVPLFSGSGMRVKILEGMAMGKVVISTGIGLEGIEATDGVSVLVADSKEGFIRNIKFCIKNRSDMMQIGQAGRNFVMENYDNLAIARKLVGVYQSKIYRESALSNALKEE